jgi:hypothetical protein
VHNSAEALVLFKNGKFEQIDARDDIKHTHNISRAVLVKCLENIDKEYSEPFEGLNEVGSKMARKQLNEPLNPIYTRPPTT